MPLRTLPLLVLVAASASAQPVTVEIDLSGLDEEARAVGLRGDTAPLAWDRSLPLEDPDGDWVYTAEVAFPDGTGAVAYKAVVEPASGDVRWEPGDNRLLFPGRMDADRRAFGAPQSDLPVLTVSSVQLAEDLGILREAMQALHPGLTLHNTDADLAAITDGLARDVRRLVATYGEAIPMPEAYLPIARAVAAIRDGHTQVSLYNQSGYIAAQLYARADRMPFTFRLVGGRMIVTGDATDEEVLPAGTEVLTLDGRPVGAVIEAMMPYASADGSNDAKRVDLLQTGDLLAPAERFDVLYSLLYEPTGPLALTVRRPNGDEEAVAAERVSATVRRDVLWARDETLPRSRGDELASSYSDDGTALLRIGSFATFNMDLDFTEWLTGAFHEMQQRGAERLIVDLRGNGGGMDDAAALLFAHLIQAPTEVMRWRGVTAFDVVPESLRPHIRSWTTDVYDLSDRVSPNGDGTFSLPEQPPVTVSPAPDAFGGEVAVLVDAGPSSATFYLADTIQQTGTAPLVGQPTGGSLKGLNGGQMVFLTLPHTGISVDIPLFGSRPATPGPDRGVIPDLLVEPDADAVIAGRDPDLDAARALLAGEVGPSESHEEADPAAPLLGTWLVDLRPTPDAPVYTQTMVVMESASRPFAGSFYGSPVESATINDDWGDLRVAFTTSDGSGTYHHTATLRGGRLHGTTHSPGRGFLAVWTAVRPLPLVSLAGEWAGTLTYTDYRDDATRVTLTASAEAEAIGGGARISVAFVEPDGSSGGTGTTDLLDGGATVGYDGQAFREVSRKVTDDGFRLVIEREGEDNGRPATIRHTLALEGDALTDRKEVRYEGGDAFFERSVFTVWRQ